MKIQVHLLPELTTPDELAAATVVVVDVLRATTTMLHALRSGASAVIPCLEVEDARRMAAASPQHFVLGGERGGVRIAGFALGNSPAEYTPSRVSGKTVVMTTTNGTRALHVCRRAERVLIGAFVNLSCLLEELTGVERLAVVCAGTNGRVTCEDVLFAGALAARMAVRQADEVERNDEGELAIAAWQAMAEEGAAPERLLAAFRRSRGGRNLVQLGMDADLALAAQIDSVPLVGELLRSPWSVVRTAART